MPQPRTTRTSAPRSPARRTGSTPSSATPRPPRRTTRPDPRDRRRRVLASAAHCDLHPFFLNDRAIDTAVRAAIFRAAREQVEVVEIICGKGSGVLRKRVLAQLGQPHLRKLYRTVDASGGNEGRILVRF